MTLTAEEMRKQVMEMNTYDTGRDRRQYNSNANGNGNGYRRNNNGYGRGVYSNKRDYRQSAYNGYNNQDTGTIRIPSKYRQNHRGNSHRQMQSNNNPQRYYNRQRGGLTPNRGRGRGRGNNNHQHQRKQMQYQRKDT